MQAWGNAPGKICSPKQALKARIKAAFGSIPHIAFVEFNAAFAQKSRHTPPENYGCDGAVPDSLRIREWRLNRAVSASEFFSQTPGALPQASINIAPLALNRYRLYHAAGHQLAHGACFDFDARFFFERLDPGGARVGCGIWPPVFQRQQHEH
jgi:hypothetical protein